MLIIIGNIGFGIYYYSAFKCGLWRMHCDRDYYHCYQYGLTRGMLYPALSPESPGWPVAEIV